MNTNQECGIFNKASIVFYSLGCPTDRVYEHFSLFYMGSIESAFPPKDNISVYITTLYMIIIYTTIYIYVLSCHL